MNRKALEAFAPTERTNLRQAVERRLSRLGINAESSYKSEKEWLSIEDGIVTINGISYTEIPRDKFIRLFREYKAVGYDSLVEETAYTWFNRLIAIRYMEVKGVLPDIVKIVGNNGVIPRPEILTNYQYLGNIIFGSEIENLKLSDEESAYRKLFLAACNKLGEALPFLFKPLDDWMELLLPDKMLEPGGLIDRIVSNEGLTNSFEEGVEAIGWLYQYYMSEKKMQVGGLKNTAVKKEDLPVVTQLFTPRWIVEYMIENSLGKLYDDWYEENNLSDNWSYYLKNVQPEKILPYFNNLEDIKFFDPACGSGHILVAAFEYFYDMYLEQGYRRTEIPLLILENNLYGCDIDKRATQITSFALYMVATEKDPRILRRSLVKKVNIYEIVDSEDFTNEDWDWLESDYYEQQILKQSVQLFENAKQCGSLIRPLIVNYDHYINKIEAAEIEGDLFEVARINQLKSLLLPILKQAKLLSEKYHIVVTNPPYHNKYNDSLKSFMVKYYKDYKSDLYSAFIIRCSELSIEKGFVSLMTPFTWMFISSHEKLREFILNNYAITSLIQPEYHACYDIAHVAICTFVIQNQSNFTEAQFVNLTSFKGDQSIWVRKAVKEKVSYRTLFDTNKFRLIPEKPIAYWVSDKVLDIFRNADLVSNIASPKAGLATGDNTIFQRFWYEVDITLLGFDYHDTNETRNQIHKWFPCNSGGEFRKWYGNNYMVVNWFNDGYEIKNFKNEKGKLKSRPQNTQFYFKEGITWTKLSSSKFGTRYKNNGFIFDDTGRSAFPNNEEDLYFILALFCSKISFTFMQMLNPTLSFTNGDINRIPVIYPNIELKNRIDLLVQQNIEISKENWDYFETSWDFTKHPLITFKNNNTLIEEAFTHWRNYSIEQFNIIKSNEEELNKLLINLYELNNELTPDVEQNDITLINANPEREAKSFLSYFIGCLMGRYSIDTSGLAYAGGEWDGSKYIRFQPSEDGIISFTDESILGDKYDVYSRLKEFISAIYGDTNLQENLSWLASNLGQKSETVEKTIRNYFFKQFYKDHLQIYQKRPIYWQIDSGKENGMKSLFYSHRYSPQTLGLAVNNHFVPLLSQWRSLSLTSEEELNSELLSASEKKEKTKQLNLYKKREEELEKFQDTLHDIAREGILIDLDEGVKENYQIFKAILTSVKM